MSCAYSVTFKAANSLEGLGLDAGGCKAGSVGYTQEQTEALKPSLSERGVPPSHSTKTEKIRVVQLLNIYLLSLSLKRLRAAFLFFAT